MRIGNRIITINRKGRSADGQGGFSEGYAELATDRGIISPSSGTGKYSANQKQAEITHTAYMRRGVDIQVADRLTMGSVNYEVVSVRNPGGRDTIKEIDCKEIQNP